MSLEHLPETTNPEIAYAKLMVLSKFANQSIVLWIQEIDSQDRQSHLEKVMMVVHHGQALSVGDNQLLTWYQHPDTPQWGLLFELTGEYLIQIRKISERIPSVAPPRIKEIEGTLIEKILAPHNAQKATFRGIKILLDEDVALKQEILPEQKHLTPLITIANIILYESFRAIRATGSTEGLITENDDMAALADAINKAADAKDPQPILEWYQRLNSPTWGHLYNRVGWYLKKIGLIETKGETIPAVLRDNEQSMLHYWARNTAVGPKIFETMWRTKKLALDKTSKKAAAPE